MPRLSNFQETGACLMLTYSRPSSLSKSSVYNGDGIANEPKKEGKMKKTGLILVAFALLFGCASTGQVSAVGEVAPDFNITDVSGDEVRLSEFKGKKNVVLVFYADST